MGIRKRWKQKRCKHEYMEIIKYPGTWGKCCKCGHEIHIKHLSIVEWRAGLNRKMDKLIEKEVKERMEEKEYPKETSTKCQKKKKK